MKYGLLFACCALWLGTACSADAVVVGTDTANAPAPLGEGGNSNGEPMEGDSEPGDNNDPAEMPGQVDGDEPPSEEPATDNPADDPSGDTPMDDPAGDQTPGDPTEEPIDEQPDMPDQDAGPAESETPAEGEGSGGSDGV